jgi:hypothetical protein
MDGFPSALNALYSILSANLKPIGASFSLLYNLAVGKDVLRFGLLSLSKSGRRQPL